MSHWVPALQSLSAWQPGVQETVVQQQVGELRNQIKSLIGVSCDMELLPEGGVPRSEGKAKRVVDRR